MPVVTLNIEGLPSFQAEVQPDQPVSVELPNVMDGIVQEGTRGYAFDIARINLL